MKRLLFQIKMIAQNQQSWSQFVNPFFNLVGILFGEMQTFIGGNKMGDGSCSKFNWLLKIGFFLWIWRKILTKTLGNINTYFVLSFEPFSYTTSISFLVKSDQSPCNQGAPVPYWTDCPKLPSSLKISDVRSSQIICTWNYTINYPYNHGLLLETLFSSF